MARQFSDLYLFIFELNFEKKIAIGCFTPNIWQIWKCFIGIFHQSKNHGIVKCCRRIVVVYSTHSLYIHIKQLCKVFTPHEKTLRVLSELVFLAFFSHSSSTLKRKSYCFQNFAQPKIRVSLRAEKKLVISLIQFLNIGPLSL